MGINAIYAEAQQAVIGSVLIDPENTLGVVMDKLRPENFEGTWRTIFEAIRSLWLDQRPVDPVMVLDHCGAGYEKTLREAMKLTPTASNVAIYCEIVKEQAALLRFHRLGMDLINAPTAELARELLASAETETLEHPGLRVYTATELLQEFYMRMMDNTPPKYLPWGIRQLDEGLTAEPGDFIILGADSSVGKTALAVQLAWAMGSRGLRVGFFSLETSAQKLTDRLVAQRARLDMEKIKRKQVEKEDLQEIVALGNASKKVPFSVIPCAGVSVADLRAVTIARRFDVIFVDYMQLLRADGQKRFEIVTNISMGLHTLAQSLGVAVVGLSQVTLEDKKNKRAPDPDSLRESRQLKQDADLILMMSLMNPNDPVGLRWLRVVKNKDGPLINICLKFDPQHMDFTATDSRAFINRMKSRKSTFMDLSDEEAGDVQEVFGL